jgi:hypothetical protein
MEKVYDPVAGQGTAEREKIPGSNCRMIKKKGLIQYLGVNL